MTQHNAIAYVVGGAPEYAHLMSFSVRSALHHEPRARIIILTDASYASTVSEALVDVPGADRVSIAITPPNMTIQEVSARKLELFECVRDLTKFAVVLYLDCDTLVRGSLDDLWDVVVSGPDDTLHVYEETSDARALVSSHFFGYGCHSEDDMVALSKARASGIGAFNAGSWAFKPTSGMRTYFQEAARIRCSRGGFWEQAAMNHVFALHARATTPTLQPMVLMHDIYAAHSPRIDKSHRIVHAANINASWQAKLSWLERLS